MSYTANVYSVMIASPSDVPTERNLARTVIHEWNAIHSRSRGIMLHPLGWETHSHPSMEDKAQNVITNQIVKQSDLLVAIFWTRLGSPTGSSASGTVEEINSHLDSGRPAMIYFSSAPVILDSIDPKQYEALKLFRDECKQKGLIETFDSPTDFREKFARQLAALINTNHIFSSPSEPKPQFQIIPEAIQVVPTAPRIRIPELSSEAKTLLLEAAADSNGIIIHAVTFGGVHIQTNNKQFIEGNDPRVVAAWEGALQELDKLRLIKDVGHKGEVFQLTREGYELADILKT